MIFLTEKYGSVVLLYILVFSHKLYFLRSKVSYDSFQTRMKNDDLNKVIFKIVNILPTKTAKTKHSKHKTGQNNRYFVPTITMCHYYKPN
jgi:hypothetical protein